MNPSSDGTAADDQSAGPESRVLYVMGRQLVTRATIDRAEAAQKAADAAPYYETFGELRRSNDLAELAERLDDRGVTVENYVMAIEVAAGRIGKGDDLAARLAAVSDFEYDGDDDLPGDEDEVRTQSDLDNEVDDHFGHEIAMGMLDDVPADVLEEFKCYVRPMFVDYTYGEVTSEDLPAMIEVLEARGFTVIDE